MRLLAQERSLTLLVGLLLLTPHMALAAEIRANDWEDPNMVGRNKEAPHATLMPFPDSAGALAGDRTASPWFHSLNGPWRFHWSPRAPEPTTAWRFSTTGPVTIDTSSSKKPAPPSATAGTTP